MPKRRRFSVESDEEANGRKGNPFTVPPNAYHIGVLRAVEPFLTIWEPEGSVEALGQKNKFYGGLMRLDTLEEVVNVLWPPERVYKKRRTEGNLRPWHLALVKAFSPLAAPSEAELRELREKCRMRRDAVGLEMLDNLGTPNSDFQGLHMVWTQHQLAHKKQILLEGPGQESGSRTTSSSRGLDMTNEQTPTNELGLAPGAAKTDIILRVHKPGIFKDKKLNLRPRNELKTEFCPCIAECKPGESELATFRNTGYGRVEVRNNIAHGHYDVMYLPVFSGHTFTYAILNVHGFVSVSGNNISDASYAKYEVHCAEKGVSPKTKGQLTTCLEAGIAELDLWNGFQPKVYPENKYIVGDLYTADKWYALPNQAVGYTSAEALFFAEAMLRIIVGDKVLSWTPDVRRAFCKQATYLKVAGRCGGVRPREDNNLSRMTDGEIRDLFGRLANEMTRRALAGQYR